MFEWYIAITSCYHSTQQPLFVKRQNANVKNTWFPIDESVFHILFSNWFAVVDVIVCYFAGLPSYVKKKNTSNPIYRSDVSIDRETITNRTYFMFVCTSEQLVSEDFVWNSFLYRLFICMCHRLHGNDYKPTPAMQHHDKKSIHCDRINSTCIRNSVDETELNWKEANSSRPTARDKLLFNKIQNCRI